MCRTHGRNPIVWAGPEHHFIGGPRAAAVGAKEQVRDRGSGCSWRVEMGWTL